MISTYCSLVSHSDQTVGSTMYDVNLRLKLSCKRCRSVTVSDQKGLITRGKKQTWGLHRRAAVVCFQHVSPLRTQDAFTCNVTGLPLFLTSASAAAGMEGSGVMVWGVWRDRVGGLLAVALTEERLTQPQPLCCTTVCLQDSKQPSAGSPPPPPSPPHSRPSNPPIWMLL